MGIILDEDIEKYRKYIKKNLNEKRYFHSISVSLTAASLAMLYEVDIKKARIAGILHDCVKNLSSSDLIKACKLEKIDINTIEYENPELLHSKYGSFIAKNKFKIDDEDILNAISYHTTGRPNMSMLEKIIFVSDYIEPNRNDLPGLAHIRQMAFIDIEKCITLICENTINFLKSKNRIIDKTTEDTYNFYLELSKE